MTEETIQNYKAERDYYPFGMLMPGRNSSPDEYRYGFNGKEYDAEWNGNPGAMYDYGFRIYDPRIARFLSVDPLTKDYPWYTPYQFAGNMPIVAIDIDGLEEYIVHNFYDKTGFIYKTQIRYATKNDIIINQNNPSNVDKKNVVVYQHYSDKTKMEFQDNLSEKQQSLLNYSQKKESSSYTTQEGKKDVKDVDVFSATQTYKKPSSIIKPDPNPQTGGTKGTPTKEIKWINIKVMSTFPETNEGKRRVNDLLKDQISILKERLGYEEVNIESIQYNQDIGGMDRIKVEPTKEGVKKQK